MIYTDQSNVVRSHKFKNTLTSFMIGGNLSKVALFETFSARDKIGTLIGESNQKWNIGIFVL